MWLFVCKSGPGDPVAVRELTDMLMTAAIFGRPVSLLLLGDGVLNLMPAPDNPLADLRDLLTQPCLADADALAGTDIDANAAVLPATAANSDSIREQFHQSSRVVMF